MKSNWRVFMIFYDAFHKVLYPFFLRKKCSLRVLSNVGALSSVYLNGFKNQINSRFNLKSMLLTNPDP